MKIIALGTGTSSGIPMIGCNCEVCLSLDTKDKRLRSSIYVQSAKAKILIDIGPDFRTQFLDNKLHTVDALLITHEHNDHIMGLDDIRAINFTQKKSIPVYSSTRVQGILKERFKYIFSDNPYPSAPQLNLYTTDNQPFTIKDIHITPINLMHGRLPIYGYRLNDIAYLTDCSAVEKEEKDKLRNLDVLIINALRKEKHPTHYNLEQALALIDELSPKQAYLTHISHKMGKTEDWSALLPGGVSPLNDKMIIEV